MPSGFCRDHTELTHMRLEFISFNTSIDMLLSLTKLSILENFLLTFEVTMATLGERMLKQLMLGVKKADP